MKKQNNRKNNTVKLLTLLIVFTLTFTAFTACSSNTALTSSELPENAAALRLVDCVEEDGKYYVLAYTLDAGQNQSKELYKLPLSARFIGEFIDPTGESETPLFFAGPVRFYENADFIDGKLQVTAFTFIFNDSGELILLSDALPEE